jgi:5-methylcytosine-specific restriction endonuclease McrA
VLNASYEPIRIINWQRAMVLSFTSRIDVLDFYSEPWVVHTVSQSFAVPAVIRMVRLHHLNRANRSVRFTRHHVFARDEFRCQYCRDSFSEKQLTLDHVVPLVKGGKTSWSNIVTCCVSCNQRKGAKTPQEAGLRLLRTPREPQRGFIPDLMFYRATSLPEAWKPFVTQWLKAAY